MTTGEKESLTVRALGLLNEQLEARIVHYKGDLETSPELDAITAQVVAQIKAMQAAAPRAVEERKDPVQAQEQQIRTMSKLLHRLFGQDTGFVAQNLKPLGRRIAKLFFESELHAKTKGDRDKVIHHAEQGVYYVLKRYKNRLTAELEGFEYVSTEIRDATMEQLSKIERELQVGFLSRRSPELNRVMTVYTAVVTDFLHQHLPPRVEQMSRVTIRASRTAYHPKAMPYKVLAESFPMFRREWERILMQQMINFCGDELLLRLKQDDVPYRDETIRFFTDPHVFSETAQVLCDALYDFLCLEGFLDLPLDWRVTLARDPA